jgi:hypothetical protein
MKTLFLLAFTLFFGTSFSQNFYLKKDNKISKEDFVTVETITQKTVKVKVYFQSSERCACESEEVFILTKKASGYYSVKPYGHEGKLIKAKVENGKVSYIVIEYDFSDNCCGFWPGVYVPNRK